VLVVSIIVGAEVLARHHMPDQLVKTRGFHVFSEVFGWASRRDVSVVVAGKRVSVNQRGYRGRELAAPRRGDRTRVIVLGDSIAFGLGVSDEETFTSLLDARDNDIEAANLAVSGYGPGQELLVLLQEGLRYDPDFVVLAFCLANDFAEALLPVALHDGTTPKPRFRLVGDRLLLDDSNLRQTAFARVHRWVSDHSLLFNLTSKFGMRGGPPTGRHWRERYNEALRDEDYALRLSLALVGRMNSVCRERGIDFLVAVFPDRFSYRTKPPLAQRFLESLETDGIPVIDMAAHFHGVGSRLKAVALDHTGHLSPTGHFVASEVLEREIAARHLRRRSALAPRTLSTRPGN
jgi:hypothetical protein